MAPAHRALLAACAVLLSACYNLEYVVRVGETERTLTQRWSMCGGELGAICSGAYDVAERTTEPEPALAALEKGLGVKEKDRAARAGLYHDLGALYAATGDWAKAIQAAKMAAKLSGDEVDEALLAAARRAGTDPAALPSAPLPGDVNGDVTARAEGDVPGPVAESESMRLALAGNPPAGVDKGPFTFPLVCDRPMWLQGVRAELAQGRSIIRAQQGCVLFLIDSTLTMSAPALAKDDFTAVLDVAGGELILLRSTIARPDGVRSGSYALRAGGPARVFLRDSTVSGEIYLGDSGDVFAASKLVLEGRFKCIGSASVSFIDLVANLAVDDLLPAIGIGCRGFLQNATISSSGGSALAVSGRHGTAAIVGGALSTTSDYAAIALSGTGGPILVQDVAAKGKRTGLRAENEARVKVVGGSLSGADNSVYVEDDATVDMKGTILEGGPPKTRESGTLNR